MAQQSMSAVRLRPRRLQRARPGPYQLQAAIAAVHDEAPSFEGTDWSQIVALYEVLLRATPTPDPVVELNHGVAVGMAHAPNLAQQRYL